MRRSFNKYYIISIILFLLHAFFIQAEEPSGERRVYYLDATYSMVSNKLWEPCKENLINAINNIEDVNTELVVVIFADDRADSKRIWKKWEEKASDDGKNSLIKNIREAPLPIKSSMTNLYTPLVDFYSEVNPDKVNYMFLMTDGGHEQGGNFYGAIDQWSLRTNERTYGFFVELTDNVGGGEIVARDKARGHIDRQTEKCRRIWRVSTADVNIDLIRLETTAIFNIRNDKYIDIPLHFSGKNDSAIKSLNFTFGDSSDLRISRTEITNNNIRLFIEHDIDIHNYPAQSTALIYVSLPSNNDRTFLLTNQIRVNCINKKELALFLSPNKLSGKVKHYDQFAWVSARTMPSEYTIDLDFSQDAIQDGQAYVELGVTDNNGAMLPPSSIIISANGEQCINNIISLSSKDKILNLTISFPDGTKRGMHQGYLKVLKHKLDRIDNLNLTDTPEANVIAWRVRYIHTMNPLARVLLWVATLLCIFIALWFLVIKPTKYPRFPRFRKTILIKRDGGIISQFTVNFKGARKVVFATMRIKQSFLNKLFTGRIDTIINPAFEETITFTPRKGKKAMARGNGYIFNPNPIPQSGTTTISHTTNNLTINLQ